MKPTVAPELTQTRFSVDKLSLTLKVRKVRWADMRFFLQSRYDVRREGKTYREHAMIKGPEGNETLLLQWSPYLGGSLPWARVEWNPAKFAGWEDVLETAVRPFLKHGWGDSHITRIDPAVDYPVALQEHVYYASNHQGQLHYTREGIETIYLGSPRSNARVRIYDKAKELEVTGEQVPDHPLTRIEVQKRSTNLSALQIRELPDPFARLKIGKPRQEGLDFKYRLYLKEAKKLGVDYVIKQLKWWDKKALKLIVLAEKGSIPHPSTVFRMAYGDFCKEHLSYFWRDHRPRVDPKDASEAWRDRQIQNA